MSEHKNPVDGLIEALESIMSLAESYNAGYIFDTAEKALKEYREAKQPKSCPLYADYKKSCKAFRTNSLISKLKEDSHDT